MIKIIPYSDKYKDRTKKLILTILEDEFGYTGINRPDLDEISISYSPMEQSNFWLAINDNRVVGTAALKNYGNKKGLLKRMYVKKEFRAQGVGQKLLYEVIKYAKNLNYSFLYTSTVDDFIAAQQFYKKNGFKIIKALPKEMGDQGDTIFMKLTI